MKAIDKLLENIFVKAILAFCTLLGGVVAIGSVFVFFFPQDGVMALNKVIAVLEEKLDEKIIVQPPSVQFLEFWQSLDDEGEIRNTMLRYYNPSPTTALEDVTVKIYHKAETGNYALLFEETRAYVKAESSRDIFDIKTSTYVNKPAIICAEYNDGSVTTTPLSPERQENQIRYAQAGDVEMYAPEKGMTCEEAVR